jgi:hypothetical protein
MTRGLIKKLDFISYQPKLYTLGDERYKTVLGGITQLMLGLIFLAGMIYFSQDIYRKINPYVIGSTSKEIYKEKIRFQSKFSVYISMMDPQLGIPFRNESIYSLKFYQNILDINKGFITTPLESEVCSKNSFEEEIPQSILDSWNWESYTCIKKGSEAYLKGSDMDLQNWFLTAFIAPCDRNQKGHKCGTEQEIRAKLTGANVQSFLIDKFLDPNNYTNPIQFYNKMIVTAASIGYKNLGWYKFKTINMIDDVGLLFEQKYTRSVITFDEVTTSFGPSTPGDPNIFQFIYQQSTNVETVTRRYKRLQEVVASVGGLLTALNIISKILVDFISEKFYFNYLYDKYFEKKKLDENEYSGIDLRKNSNFKSNPTFNNYVKPSDTTSKQELRDAKINSLKSTIQKTVPRSITKSSRLTRNHSSYYLKKMMDYEYIMMMFKEIELLKIILLSTEQNKNFRKIVNNELFSHLFWTANDIEDGFRAEEQEIFNKAISKFEKIFEK